MKIAIQWWLPRVAVLPVLGALALAAGPGNEEQGLTQHAVEIGRPLSFPITNSMVVTWIVAAGLIVFARVATRHMKQVPDGAQNFLEWLIAGLYGFLEGVIGPHLVKRTFWFFATIFIFILAGNWFGLVPGVGTIGWGHQTPEGFKIDEPLLRGANADLNLTLAMALVFFACWIVWALQEVGPKGFLKELFAPKGETTGLLKVLTRLGTPYFADRPVRIVGKQKLAMVAGCVDDSLRLGIVGRSSLGARDCEAPMFLLV